MTARRDAPRGRGDAGQAAVEFLGAIPYLVLGFLALLQTTFAVSTVQATAAAARAGARAVSQGDAGGATNAAQDAVPSWLQAKIQVQVGGGTRAAVAVSTPIPVVLPGLTGPTVTRTAWFDLEHGTTPWG